MTTNSLTHIFAEIDKWLPLKSAELLRLVHGRGQAVTGGEFLAIDWYPPIVLITLYEEKDECWLGQLRDGLENLLKEQLAGIAVQIRNKSADPYVLAGDVPQRLVVNEEGLLYQIEPLASQNIGFFPDMRNGRQLIRQMASGKKVLNLFAYTCAFSVAAIAGGASHVLNLDMNRNLLERGRENHRLNQHDLRNVDFLPYNLFKSFGRLKQRAPFDLIIIDPPFHQGDSFKAKRDWPKIIRRLPELLTPEGEIVAAVSAPELGRDFLRQQFIDNLPEAKLVCELTAGDNFPEVDLDKGLHIQRYRLQTP